MIQPTRRQLIRGAAVLGLSAAFGGAADPFAPPACAADNDVRTLADILPGASWDVDSRGPLLIVDPAGTARIKDESGSPAGLPEPDPDGRISLVRSLAVFARHTYPMGTLTVIAPTEMTVVVDDPPKNPNLWEGLSTTEKLQYLLSLLAPGQWEKLGSEQGLGAADLKTHDQHDIFLSLLPEPFAIRTGTVGAHGSVENLGERRTLTADERTAVRVRVQRTLYLKIPNLVDADTTSATLSAFNGRTGDRASVRDDAVDSDGKSAFGVNMATRTPNRPRVSDLAYDTDARLAAGMSLTSLPAMATIGNLVAAAAAATGIELIADFRVAGLSVDVRGAAVRVGDLLQALALAVCGTWRRVGSGETYLLTAETTGAGTRKLRLAEWYADLGALKEQHVREWRNAAITAGFRRYVVSRASAPTTPASDSENETSIADSTHGQINTSDLPAAERETAGHAFAALTEQSPGWDPDHVMATEVATGQFLLPDGTPIVGTVEMDLGLMRTYTQPDDPAAQTGDDHPEASLLQLLLHQPGARQPPYHLPASGRTIVMAASTAEEAEKLASTARQYGFRELWVRTDDPAVLSAAIAGAERSEAAGNARGGASSTVWALASVFASNSGIAGAEETQDRNLLGETGVQAAQGRARVARWASVIKNVRMTAYPLPDAADFIGPPPSIPPDGAAWSARARRLTELASVPGLAGLALDPRFPEGYETTRSQKVQEGYDGPLSVRAELGYADGMRLAFLRAEGVDPIDLIPENLTLPVDLRTPFFLDDRARGTTPNDNAGANPIAGFSEKAAQWDSFRVARRLDALISLRKAIADRRPDLHVLAAPVQTARVYGRTRRYGPAPLYALWSATHEAPSEHAPDTNPFGPDSVRVRESAVAMVIAPAPPDGSGGGSADYAAFTFANPNEGPPGRLSALQQHSVALDVSALSPSASSELLAKWVAPAVGGEMPASRSS